ncbi:YeeE/YedE family protein [Arenimonas terrae]|uniref:YeeE/YedE family protein n=1 Tax=Arenimonas terrae TaxID=2546226 RepID=A0A5C4RS36_9GAMM|nr:YeeE/YedE thiosulfate transporter family protein [Arenimonas terrae]TNJ33775.1 YeeE/YedE family protein [Arenimonas terrae]
MVTESTPLASLAGGALIGLSATALLWLNGRIAGISGIAWSALRETGGERRWRLMFLAGLIAGAGLWFAFAPGIAAPREGFALPLLLAGALLVGVGTRLGSGCTSGHGICGLARLSPRSLAAVVVFMAVAIATTTGVRHVFA